ncbi:hypothetical protein IE53DRAFT_326011 [Violaceomyces palustris]|uniref:Uncharacterized protein n=1 Tax=Violaceomyces palustris TaxID=1673888 RepID=A0ACD0P3Z2_9BASI|nr:hypothetical protein IE53DRAFT_326011 [Violaceomyces palustris]
MLANTLSQLARLNEALANQVNEVYYPFPLSTTLHALRVSIAYRGICKAFDARYRTQGQEVKRRGWLYEIAGFLVMAWGGSILTNQLLLTTPVQLLSFQPLLNYLSVHLLVGLYQNLLPTPSASILDSTLFLLDGSTRTSATYASLLSVKNHVNPKVATSLPLEILCGTLAASGGGQLAFTLNVFDPNLGWKLATPPFLRSESGWIDRIDVLAPLVATLLYGILTDSNQAYENVISLTLVHPPKPILSQVGGKAILSLVISSAFALRALVLHHLPTKTPPQPVEEESKAKLVKNVASSKRRA